MRNLAVVNIGDSMNRMTVTGPRLRPFHAGGVLCGPAVTVKPRPGDNPMTHMALNLAVEGDIIVFDACGELTNAIAAERMLAYCVAGKFGGYRDQWRGARPRLDQNPELSGPCCRSHPPGTLVAHLEHLDHGLLRGGARGPHISESEPREGPMR